VIKFEIDHHEIEVLVDNAGLDELIWYLKGIRDAKDHMHGRAGA
jgi:hypothetical protein